MSAIDTPDYQRGIVNAQVLLAKVTTGAGHVSVSLPPNIETLIVCGEQAATLNGVSVVGDQSGADYIVQFMRTTQGGGAASTIVADVSSALDTSVTITVGSVTQGNWYVYGDSGVHMVTEMSHLINGYGQAYTIPSVPSTAAGNHPPTEISYYTAGLTAAGNVLAAPAAGSRYRIFGVLLQVPSTTPVCYLDASGAGQTLCGCLGGQTMVPRLPAQGVAWPAAAPVHLSYGSGSGTIVVGVQYTTEEV